MKSVAIIGAGITGLTAAFYLKRKGIPVTVYETGDRVGGVIQSTRREGYLAESGPNTILETSPQIRQLVADAGLEARRIYPNPGANRRYIVRYGRPIAMPGSPLGFFTTELFSAKAKMAVVREPFIPARRDGAEESIAQFVRRRLNQEFLDHAVDPLVAGIYAGDPEKLSVTHAFPRLKALEDNYGSIIRGQIFGARERKRNNTVARNRAPAFSFDQGLQVLPDALGVELGGAIQLKTPVTKLTQTADGWMLTLSDGATLRQVEHSAVIYCGTAFKLGEMPIELRQGGTGSLRTEAFSEVRYPPVASVVLGFRREDVVHPCEGFGMLIPKVEGFKILGTIFSSSLFPNRAPAGHLTLTSYIGGARQPELASLPAEQLYELTCEALRELLGVRGTPAFQHATFYPRAIPQYNVGYGRYLELMKDVETKAPGLFFAGHYRDGVSLSDSILSGCKVVERAVNSSQR